ncbi:MAG: hypothetical protein JST25_05900 [Actinobacteria bacterium]|nr:hypothetical protein [Actinomycetota bacterium]
MSSTDGTRDPRAAADSLAAADAIARRIRSHRRWYVVGALVMAVALAAFTVAVVSWPDQLAELIIPGILVIGGVLAILAWRGRTIPTAASAANRVIVVTAVLMIVVFLLNRFVLPEGFTAWALLVGLLPALPFVYLARRVGRS